MPSVPTGWTVWRWVLFRGPRGFWVWPWWFYRRERGWISSSGGVRWWSGVEYCGQRWGYGGQRRLGPVVFAWGKLDSGGWTRGVKGEGGTFLWMYRSAVMASGPRLTHGRSEVSSMAGDVAMFMGNLKCLEVELSVLENVVLHSKEQSNETERWVVAKLFTTRKVEGEDMRGKGSDSCKGKPIVYNNPAGTRGGGR
ncbi:hypothetical protein V6N12_057028 [Hibiscus sabdariffa]|uniref:Uncharacterized protein n=1 Tax=Hibiscus sabdariffa TaxID=183260 RepID=A0ABR2DCX1_9ROSI